MREVFISHASEDKADVATPLARCLQDAGVSVWLDVLELKIGDSLRRRIDQGLARSAFGVVIFSRAFFEKGWTQYELDGIVTRSVSGEQSLLPIWHNITKDEVIAQSPSLADKLARSTAQHTVAEIAREIADVVIASRGSG
ncbi:toll/interleukin-1 receptor domain-containing protein [Kitasatospora cineracea]|uniref:toll/interleukin-1 receptor domain-containing protein n=1 Tax=Kitasatospora cineracea TaxID=88074 RepID=UPI0036DA3323